MGLLLPGRGDRCLGRPADRDLVRARLHTRRLLLRLSELAAGSEGAPWRGRGRSPLHAPHLVVLPFLSALARVLAPFGPCPRAHARRRPRAPWNGLRYLPTTRRFCHMGAVRRELHGVARGFRAADFGCPHGPRRYLLPTRRLSPSPPLGGQPAIPRRNLFRDGGLLQHQARHSRRGIRALGRAYVDQNADTCPPAVRGRRDPGYARLGLRARALRWVGTDPDWPSGTPGLASDRERPAGDEFPSTRGPERSDRVSPARSRCPRNDRRPAFSGGTRRAPGGRSQSRFRLRMLRRPLFRRLRRGEPVPLPVQLRRPDAHTRAAPRRTPGTGPTPLSAPGACRISRVCRTHTGF